MCAASGVTSPTTNASSVATNRAAPVQRFQLAAVNQTNQTAATRKRMRNRGGSQRARVPLQETSGTRPSCTTSAMRHPKTQLDLADAIGGTIALRRWGQIHAESDGPGRRPDRLSLRPQ